MIDDWTKLLDDTKCKAVRLLLVDMTKAFDRMSHLKLLEKQSKMEINCNVIELCNNFLSNRTQCVKFKNHKSAYLPIHLGVPQGTVVIDVH